MKTYTLFAVTLASSMILSSIGSAQTASFDNLPLGKPTNDFVDPASGIRFKMTTFVGAAQNFVIANPTAGNSPKPTPSHYLTGDAYPIPTGNVTLVPYLDFTMTFPTSISNFRMDYLTGNGPNSGGRPNLRLDLFNAAGTLLASPEYALDANPARENLVSFNRPTADVRSVHVIPSMYSAIDNIVVSPEPATLAGAALPSLLLRRRRTR